MMHVGGCWTLLEGRLNKCDLGDQCIVLYKLQEGAYYLKNRVLNLKIDLEVV
jgi:hypothetical protein